MDYLNALSNSYTIYMHVTCKTLAQTRFMQCFIPNLLASHQYHSYVMYVIYIILVNDFFSKSILVFSSSNSTKLAGRGGKKGAVEKCGTCRGSGMQVHIRTLGPGMVQQIQSMCSSCEGQGERISAKDRCKSCQGQKVIRERKILEVHIDKGIVYVYTILTLRALV